VLLSREDEEVASLFTHLMGHRYNLILGYEPTMVAKLGTTFELTIQHVENKSDVRKITSDQLLVATGRVPVSDKLDLAKTGVKTDDKGFIITDDYLETNVKGIFALGDAVGRYPFKHAANHEAQYAYQNILNPQNRVPVDYTAMPHAIFTYPQIAAVGRTEQELKTANVDYIVGRWNYIDTAMGKAIEDQTGFVKFLLDRNTRKILGCHIIGTDASTLIHEVLVAMKSGDGTSESIRTTIHVHPALSEVVRRATEYLYDPRHVHTHEHTHEHSEQ
jgi:mycothione reductase